MAFCKELSQPKKEKIPPRPNFMTPEEYEVGRRAWWETCVDGDLGDLKTSIRWIKFILAILVVTLGYVIKKIWP
jgi:hypothetical protein